MSRRYTAQIDCADQTLLRRFYGLGAGHTPPVAQTLFLADEGSPNLTLAVELLRGLGCEVRRPDRNGHLLVEVQRPEGVTICGLGGEKNPGAQSDADIYPLTINQEKDRAQLPFGNSFSFGEAHGLGD